MEYSSRKDKVVASSSQRPKWVIDINNHLKEEAIPNSSEFCTISRAPPSMRMVDEDNYIPKLVSIGPFHRDNSKLQSMEAHKLRFLYGILDPMSKKTHTVESSVRNWRAQYVTLDGLERAMKKLEKKTRDCYSEKFDALSSDDFVRLMVIDGCFVVELLRLCAMTRKEKVADPILSTRFMLSVLGRDLLMLENQLPLFMLQTLYELTAPQQDAAPLNSLAIKFFNTLVPGRTENSTGTYDVEGKEHIHLLALFHSSFITNTTHSINVTKNWLSGGGQVRVPKIWWFSSATVLRCAGVSFNKKAGCFLDIGFVNKVLEIPPLFMNSSQTRFLRNAVAYEQCNANAKTYFTTLVVFFMNLVGSPKEVEFLRRREIIRTLDSNEETADVLNNLTKGIVYSIADCYIPDVIEKINKFTEGRWNFWKATLNLYYFVNQEPINLLLLYLTIIQTVSSLYQIFSTIKF